VWEIAIKYALGTLELHAAPELYIPEVLREMGIHAMAISFVHSIEAESFRNIIAIRSTGC
jgi:PIN domain nuclease of toxin-antitoxin system